MTQGTPQSNLDLELLAAELRRHSEDLSLYSGMLLNVLAAALPPELIKVRHEGALKARLAGRKPAVLAVWITLNGQRYELERPSFGARAVARIRHESGGVVLSSREVSAHEWSRGLAADLIAVAGTNAEAAAALARLTSG